LKSNSGEKTLLASVLMSAPGPLVLGIALFFGRSSTQLADFIRRSTELVAIIISWMIYKNIKRSEDISDLEKSKLEKIANMSIGVTLCLSGATILFVTILSKNSEKGNVIPGLIIAILGVIVNSMFWLRYKKLFKGENNSIYKMQGKLYGAKSLVDCCVAVALLAIVIQPNSIITYFIDIFGSIVVSVYLLWSGISTLTKPHSSIVLKG